MSLFLASDVLIAVPCTKKEVLICCQKPVSFDVAWRPQESPFIISRELQDIKSHLKIRNLKIRK